LIGRTLEVLVDSHSRRDVAEWAARTSCNRVVNFAAPGLEAGEFTRVRIVAAGPNSLRGEHVVESGARSGTEAGPSAASA
jgi:tRNA-2-methylthio-N6-dimethylallyladenosine synthase